MDPETLIVVELLWGVRGKMVVVFLLCLFVSFGEGGKGAIYMNFYVYTHTRTCMHLYIHHIYLHIGAPNLTCRFLINICTLT